MENDEIGFDGMLFLAAMIENEGGEYVLPFSAFEVVSTTGDKAITVDPTDDGATVTIRLVDVGTVDNA